MRIKVCCVKPREALVERQVKPSVDNYVPSALNSGRCGEPWGLNSLPVLLTRTERCCGLRLTTLIRSAKRKKARVTWPSD